MDPTHNIDTTTLENQVGSEIVASALLQKVNLTAENEMDWAILDSGASSHFLLSSAPVHDKQVATAPLTIKLPNGATVKSSHTANIALPQLPPMARIAHIVPGLASHSLVSVVKLCNAGCQVKIDDISCEVHYRGRVVIKCSKCTKTGLWMLPLTESANELAGSITQNDLSQLDHAALHAHVTSTKSEMVQFYHQALFSPPAITLLKAIKNKQLESFPGLVPSLLKHLPPSTATAKGHMKKNPKGLRSTRTDTQARKDAHLDILDMNPPQKICAAHEHNVVCYAALADTIKGTIYTDLPGPFPVRSIQNMQYIFVCYVYEANAILVRPMKSRSDACMVAAYKDIYEYLESVNQKPTLNIIDNEASRAVQTYIKSKDVDWQLVEPDNHRVNAAERAIQTFKNHFLAGLATVDRAFPLQLWCYLLFQAEMTLNMLRTSRTDPSKSAYEILEGAFDFNKTPLAPPGTKALIYEAITRRA